MKNEHLLKLCGIKNIPKSKKAVRPPLGYPGNKYRSLDFILPHIPYRRGYCEPFGGMGTVLLNRSVSPFEILNDRYTAIADLFKVLHQKEYLDRFIEKIELTVHSRDFFTWCQETYEKEQDIVDRAFKWYYYHTYSFGQWGLLFGRSTGDKNADSGKIYSRIPYLREIHTRIQNVLIENKDAIEILETFDAHDMVFYIDPPYLDTTSKKYKYNYSEEQHRTLLDTIFKLKGFCAVSTYDNDLYASYPWDKVERWSIDKKMKSMAFTEDNNMAHIESYTRGAVEEVLYIKE